MTRTANDDHGYGGDAPAYALDSDEDWCWMCNARIVCLDTYLAHADRHARARVAAMERADAEHDDIRRQVRREREMRRSDRP